ncbi:MAG TPA: 1-deoxy-D-xylulose-5-phosphate reductoisomerase [Desulfomonilia bacterium]|nr:1-deoxy-D-xylulose-5-phosphate reductoisomerase [Desulfomonilia bacterium]
MKRIVVLGSTGSIGLSTLDVIRMHPQRFRLVGLAAGSNISLLTRQANEFDVENLGAFSSSASGMTETDIIRGETAAVEVIRRSAPDIVVNGISGAAGFLPSLEAVRSGAMLALANKESLVIGGGFLIHEAKERGVPIIPVDSEHSAVFQCLNGENYSALRRIILTASGGPFRDRPKETFKDITPQEALNHPTWSMGRRITIDSATMMNKGLEIIEASRLFGVDIDNIEVTIHPQSIVHSMVEFIDGSTKAQLSVPDMRLAIAYALSWPERLDLSMKKLPLAEPLKLDFIPPDEEKFPALGLARYAMSRPDVLPCIMNAADEVAVEAFLNRRLRFDEIIAVVKKTMDTLDRSEVQGPQEVIDLDKKSRKTAEAIIS